MPLFQPARARICVQQHIIRIHKHCRHRFFAKEKEKQNEKKKERKRKKKKGRKKEKRLLTDCIQTDLKPRTQKKCTVMIADYSPVADCGVNT
jgi:hypothetical protein